MTLARHELKVIHGGKPPAYLGLPCDCCCRKPDAPGKCGECAFLAARKRVIAERHKGKDQRRRKNMEAVH